MKAIWILIVLAAIARGVWWLGGNMAGMIATGVCGGLAILLLARLVYLKVQQHKAEKAINRIFGKGEN